MNKNALFCIKAIVVSGRGIASKNVEAEPKSSVIKNKTLFPGTLNLIGKEPIVFRLQASENEVTSRAQFYSIVLNGTKCWVRRYPQCPFHILEVVSEVNLRNALEVIDGSEVNLEMDSRVLEPIGFFRNLGWHLAWKGREFWFYRFDWYPKLISKFLNLRYRVRKLLLLK